MFRFCYGFPQNPSIVLCYFPKLCLDLLLLAHICYTPAQAPSAQASGLLLSDLLHFNFLLN